MKPHDSMKKQSSLTNRNNLTIKKEIQQLLNQNNYLIKNNKQNSVRTSVSISRPSSKFKTSKNSRKNLIYN